MSDARAAVLGLLLTATLVYPAASAPSRPVDVPGSAAIPGLSFTSLTGVVPASLGSQLAVAPVSLTLPAALPAEANAASASEAAPASPSAEAALEAASAAGAAAQAAKDGEQAEAAASQGFDGAAALSTWADSGSPSLVAADPAQTARLEEILSAASRSKTGRAVLARIQALTRKRGRPLLVAIGGMNATTAAEYALDHELVTLGRDTLKQEPEAVAPLLLHELQHAAQYADEMPSGSLEAEIDAYLIQFRSAEELGWMPPRSHFHNAGLRKLKKGADEFIVFLRRQYPTSLGLVGSSAREYREKLERRLKRLVSKGVKLQRELEEKDVVLARMRETGQAASSMERFERDERAPLVVRLRDNAEEKRWTEHDLEILRDPARLARYRQFAENVMRRARTYHARLAAG